MLENFKILREIDSLSRQKDEHFASIKAENLRIEKIQSQISSRNLELEDHLEKLKSISLEITSFENELELSIHKKESKENQKASVFTETQINALAKDISVLQERIEDLEVNVLEKMEIKEELQEKIKNAENFHIGAKESLLEIQEEVSLFTDKEESKLKNIEQRICALKNDLSPDFKIKLENILSKNLRTTSLAKIENKSCNYCKMQIDSIKINAVEDKHQLKTCSQCQRILMPSSSFY